MSASPSPSAGKGLFEGLSMAPSGSPTKKDTNKEEDSEGESNLDSQPETKSVEEKDEEKEEEKAAESQPAPASPAPTPSSPGPTPSSPPPTPSSPAPTSTETLAVAVVAETPDRTEPSSEGNSATNTEEVASLPNTGEVASLPNTGEVPSTPLPNRSASSTLQSPAPTTPAPSSTEAAAAALQFAKKPGKIPRSVQVPHPDSALRILRKFATKSAPHIPASAGGSKPEGILGYIFGSPSYAATKKKKLQQQQSGTFDKVSADPCLSAYSCLVDALTASSPSEDDNATSAPTDESDQVVESILGRTGDGPARAREAAAAFVHLVIVWSRSGIAGGTRDEEQKMEGKPPSSISAELIGLAIDCSESLVARGCIDGVLIVYDDPAARVSDEDDYEDDISPNSRPDRNFMKAINLLTESVCRSDLSSERTELSALKFLLTTGCRIVSPNASGAALASTLMGDAMIRGMHLLHAVRVCYHVYLKTASEPNKTTARAALRQLIAEVFSRMERRNETLALASAAVANTEDTKVEIEPNVESTQPKETKADAKPEDNEASNGLPGEADEKKSKKEKDADFPSLDHRDAFLVLRSLCKLSMRSLPNGVTTGASSSAPMSLRAATSWESGGTNDSSTIQSGGGGAAAGVSGEAPIAVLTNGGASSALAATNPALESKILALDLLLYVLQHTSAVSLWTSGPQFVYAVRNYLCVSLLKNCTSDDTTIVNLSLRLFVPLIRNFRTHLKTEIEAFVTNVFFVILDSENSAMSHKSLVVTLFEEICSDPDTLAEIFLNYDCDLSAVDLFQRIVNALARMAGVGLDNDGVDNALAGVSGAAGSMLFVAGAGAARAERSRQEHRELRLDALRAVRRVLASLHSSIVMPMDEAGPEVSSAKKIVSNSDDPELHSGIKTPQPTSSADGSSEPASSDLAEASSLINGSRRTIVEIYDSKKRRKEEEARAVLKFNQKPSSGIRYAAECGHINGDDPADVAAYLLSNKDVFEKTQIGEYLGREADYQNGFSLRVLHAYVDQMNFAGLVIDEAIRYFLSGFRLPGEAQKIDRIMEKFAERYTLQNPTVFPSADVAFILSFSIIMLNTDRHNPAIKEERRMTKEGFRSNNRGICDGQDLPGDFLDGIFDRIDSEPISLKEDDEARERLGEEGKGTNVAADAANALNTALFFGSHIVEFDRNRESNYKKERDQIVRNTESLLRRKKKSPSVLGKEEPSGPASAAASKKGIVQFVRTEDTGLRDEYVTPMFDVAWGPALAVFSTAMESANGTVGALASIATEEEKEIAAENAAEAIEVCLDGFQLAVCTAGLCGNDTARSAFVRALSNFSLLGTGRLLEYRHVRCVQTLLQMGRDDGELLGPSWEHVFTALSEVARLNQLFELMSRNDRAAAAAAERRRKRMEEREARKAALESNGGDMAGGPMSETEDEDEISDDDTNYESEDGMMEEEMDKRMIDEANAQIIHETIPETMLDVVYHRSVSLSSPSVKQFVFQLCRVSRMEISGYGGHVGSEANDIDLTAVHYRQQHTLLTNSLQDSGRQSHHNQPDIYSLQKLVEVAHYNMDSRPRLVFSDIWNTVSAHLTSTALHSNPAVATYAVDSFRQLSIQFMQRDELGVFEFQRKFLKPFETVMARCSHVSVKELLLNCVEQIILLFGSDQEEPSSKGKSQSVHKQYRDTLRSGWRPVLTVLGLAGQDFDDGIANTGFKMLTAQLRQCISMEESVEDPDGKSGSQSSLVLRADRFVDLVGALLMYVSGTREDMSLLSIDHLVTLSNFLADESIPLPVTRARSASFSRTLASVGVQNGDEKPVSEEKSSQPSGHNNNEELELWWPILLGLSRTVGDTRRTVRTKSLVTLLSIVNKHFFPATEKTASDNVEQIEGSLSTPPQHGDLQTLQLIFRGVLTPMLEHAEMLAASASPPPLPSDFEFFITSSPNQSDSASSNRGGANSSGSNDSSWIDTTLDQLMDGCISLCLRSIESFDTDILVEEVLAMFNSCLLSDSGALAVRGLRRLHQFVSEDLDDDRITDATWAMVCHMLRRCLSVRGLPSLSPDVSDPSPSSEAKTDGIDEDTKPTETNNEEEEAKEEGSVMNEFVLEEGLLADRRYIGSNATMIIGSILGNSKYVSLMGLRWYLFLSNGLGRGVMEWEEAASIIASYPPQVARPNNSLSPPHYLENALYGRKWLVRFLQYLITKENVLSATSKSGIDGRRSALSAKALIKDQIEAILVSYMEKEASVGGGAGGSSISIEARATEMKLMTNVVSQLLDCLLKLDDEALFVLSSLTPTLSGCIQSSNKKVRSTVHELTQRMFNGPLSDKMKEKSSAAQATSNADDKKEQTK